MSKKKSVLWLCVFGAACATTPVTPTRDQLMSLPPHELTRFCKQICNDESQNNHRISMGTLRSAFPYIDYYRAGARRVQQVLDSGGMSRQFRAYSYENGQNTVTRIEQTIICVGAAHDGNQFYIDNAPNCTVQKICSSLSLIDPLNLGVGCGMN
jgi:hypothetical protein